MARFVLVHGAWHGGWCFAEVARELQQRGHEAWAPDLPCDDTTKNQLDYAAGLGDCSDAVVLGHSLGAQTIVHVPAARHVYLAPVLPIENVFAEAFTPEFGGPVRDAEGRSYWADPETTALKLYPDCTRAQSDWAFERLRPQASFPSIACELAPGDVLVATTRDAAIDPDWQVRTGRALGLDVLKLDAGHSPFITQPAELAELLGSIAER